MTIFNSLKRKMSYAAWASSNYRRNEKAKQELAKFIPERREAFMPSRSGTHNPRDDLAVI
jgi:hypothetical protein